MFTFPSNQDFDDLNQTDEKTHFARPQSNSSSTDNGDTGTRLFCRYSQHRNHPLGYILAGLIFCVKFTALNLFLIVIFFIATSIVTIAIVYINLALKHFHDVSASVPLNRTESDGGVELGGMPVFIRWAELPSSNGRAELNRRPQLRERVKMNRVGSGNDKYSSFMPIQHNLNSAFPFSFKAIAEEKVRFPRLVELVNASMNDNLLRAFFKERTKKNSSVKISSAMFVDFLER